MDFWKLSFDQWCGMYTPCLQQIDLINKWDYIIHTFNSFRTELRPCWLSYSCSRLITKAVLGLYLISTIFAYDCVCVTWYSSLWSYWRPDPYFFFSSMFSPSTTVLSVFQPFCDTFLIKWWICSADRNLDGQLFLLVMFSGEGNTSSVLSHL